MGRDKKTAQQAGLGSEEEAQAKKQKTEQEVVEVADDSENESEGSEGDFPAELLVEHKWENGQKYYAKFIGLVVEGEEEEKEEEEGPEKPTWKGKHAFQLVETSFFAKSEEDEPQFLVTPIIAIDFKEDSETKVSESVSQSGDVFFEMEVVDKEDKSGFEADELEGAEEGKERIEHRFKINTLSEETKKEVEEKFPADDDAIDFGLEGGSDDDEEEEGDDQ
eukprot:TRINITY_DN526_c0_g1_i2.p1 TRINITY_DN526_c0_g1~~TRINITY_DN526_c0_g1_i2.p1  ORF type:complete len:248 (-),score=141.51 TRINITY_DN526_c0_g1_i2:79-741(-)